MAPPDYDERFRRFVEAADSADRPSPLIDAHTHIGHVRNDELPVTSERLIEFMDGAGIDRAVIQSLESPEVGARYVTADRVLAAANRYPDRLIPFCSIDPRKDFTDVEFAERIEEYVDRGARGFGEIVCGLRIDDERLGTLFGICADRGLPVLVYMNRAQPGLQDDPGLPGLERVLERHQELTLIMHGHGWWSHISADVTGGDMGRYPEGPVEPGGRCAELLDRYDGLYADYSMGSGFNAITRDPEYGESFLADHCDSLLWASDYLYPGQAIPQLGFFSRFDLPMSAWTAMCHGNIRSILG